MHDTHAQNGFNQSDDNKSWVFSFLVNLSTMCKCFSSISTNNLISIQISQNIFDYIMFCIFRAQLVKFIGSNIGTVWSIWIDWLDGSALIEASIFSIRHVNVCAIVCIAVHYFHGFCYCNCNYDVYWFRYYWRSVWIHIFSTSFDYFFTVVKLITCLCSTELNSIRFIHIFKLGTLITMASALLFGFLGAVILFFLFFGFFMMSGYFGLVKICELFDYPNKQRAVVQYFRGSKKPVATEKKNWKIPLRNIHSIWK